MKQQSVSQRILKRLDVRAFYGQYTELSSPSLKGECRGRCPLHGEDKPSFFVNVKDGSFHCWPTKSAKCRYIPLTDFAIRHLRSLTRVVGQPEMFLKADRTPWVEPKETFYNARTAAGLDWVGFHDLRHFRITQWVKHGVDLRTVKELAGHSDISTTMRYAHFAPKHASKLVREVERAELRELEEALSEKSCSDFVPTSQSAG